MKGVRRPEISRNIPGDLHDTFINKNPVFFDANFVNSGSPPKTVIFYILSVFQRFYPFLVKNATFVTIQA